MPVRYGGRRFPFQPIWIKPQHVAASTSTANCTGVVPLAGLGTLGAAKALAKATGNAPLSLGCAGAAKAVTKTTGAVPLVGLACTGAAKTVAKAAGVVTLVLGSTGTATVKVKGTTTGVPLLGLGVTGHAGIPNANATGVIPLPSLGTTGLAKSKPKTMGAVPFSGLGCAGHGGTPARALGSVLLPGLAGAGSAGLPVVAPVTTHYQAQINLALRLIREKGTTAVLRHFPVRGPSVRNRVTDSVANDGHVDYTIDLVIMPLPLPKGAKESADLVLSRARIVYVAGSTCPVYPHKDDRIVGLEGLTWTLIDDGKRLGPDAGPAIIYTLKVQR